MAKIIETLSVAANLLRQLPGGHGQIIDELGQQQVELITPLREAKAALVGDSNDAEHDALVSLMRAMGEPDVPECNCIEAHSWYGEGHATACPCSEWEAA